MRRFPVFVACLLLLPFCARLDSQQFPKPPIDTTTTGQPQTIQLDVLVKDPCGATTARSAATGLLPSSITAKRKNWSALRR